jgi:hypothetical protein
MNMELHAKGASFIAASTEDNPRDLLVALIAKHPGTDRKAIFEMFCSDIDIDLTNPYQRAVAWYFFVNMHDYLTTNRNYKPDPIERARAKAQQSEEVERIKGQIMLLNLTMPNGKPMRDCTGAEMAKFGNRYQRIAEKVGKAKLVGLVLNEEQVQEIMK